MNQEKDHNELRELILRYLSGAMSDKEAHGFEKRALDDPALADALEGYEDFNVTDIEADLEELEASFEQSRSRISYFAVAASIILLISASFFVWDFMYDNQGQEQVGQNIEKPVKSERLDESFDKLQTAPAQPAQPDKLEELAQPFDELRAVPEQPLDKLRTMPNEPDQLGERAAPAPPEEQVTLDLALELDEEIAEDEVGADYSQPQVEFEQNREPAAQPALPKSARTEALMSAASSEDFTPAEPIGGDERFEAFLENNRSYPDSLASSSVVLELEISEKGEVKNIKIIESPSAIHSEEARRLIYAYVGFEPAKSGEVTMSSKLKLTVKFP